MDRERSIRSCPSSSAGFAGAIEFRGEGLGGGRRGPLPRNYALGILLGAVAVVAFFLTRG
jgi:hypothetical protein